MPVLRWASGQRLDQSLLDLQLPAYERLLAHAPRTYRAMVTSGDVLLQFARTLPDLPAADVLVLGMWVRPDVATDFGVLFQQRGAGSELAFFLQKPEPARIHELSRDHLFMVDTGIWLLSTRAIELLMKRCGWNPETSAFGGGSPDPYELYAGFGLGLGSNPTHRDPEINALSAAVVALPEAEFHHLGTSRQMIESATRLQNQQLDQTKLGETVAARHPDQHILSAQFTAARNPDALHTLWVENSVIPPGWRLSHSHVLTRCAGQFLDHRPCARHLPRLHPDRSGAVRRPPIRDRRYLPRHLGRGNHAMAGPAGDAMVWKRTGFPSTRRASRRRRTSSRRRCSLSSPLKRSTRL